MSKFLESLIIGVKRRWIGAFARSLSALGSIWLITEITTRIFADFDQFLNKNGTLYLIFAGLCAALAFLITAYEARNVVFTIPNTDGKLSLKFSSIFDEDSDWIIGVNEFFDSTIGDIISPSSLHGQIISKIYNGNEANFRHDVDDALANASFEGQPVERAAGQTVKFPLGTTVAIARGPRKIFLVAITKTDLVTHRASSTVPILWDALGEALKQVDNLGNGEPLAMPLIGNGRASLNIPPQHLLRLITLNLTEAAKQHDLPKNITINLTDDCFDQLDLIEIKRGWSVI